MSTVGALAAPWSLAQGAVLAQDTVPADDTARTITLVIGALLAVAVLLVLLTAWYWRRTDPRRAARRSGSTEPAKGSSPAERPAPQHRAAPQQSQPAKPAEGGMSAEEWLRLTGPGQSPPPSDS
jgi:hypothetical protein